MTEKFRKMWKELVVDYFKVLSLHFCGGSEKKDAVYYISYSFCLQILD